MGRTDEKRGMGPIPVRHSTVGSSQLKYYVYSENVVVFQ
jgi:hypothetical protein